MGVVISVSIGCMCHGHMSRGRLFTQVSRFCQDFSTKVSSADTKDKDKDVGTVLLV
jgi:hypothetical protein